MRWHLYLEKIHVTFGCNVATTVVQINYLHMVRVTDIDCWQDVDQICIIIRHLEATYPLPAVNYSVLRSHPCCVIWARTAAEACRGKSGFLFPLIILTAPYPGGRRNLYPSRLSLSSVGGHFSLGVVGPEYLRRTAANGYQVEFRNHWQYIVTILIVVVICVFIGPKAGISVVHSICLYKWYEINAIFLIYWR